MVEADQKRFPRADFPGTPIASLLMTVSSRSIFEGIGFFTQVSANQEISMERDLIICTRTKEQRPDIYRK
jgi:hypothetical protein